MSPGPVLSISGTELRQRLAEGRDLPTWFTPPEIAAELRRSYPPGNGRSKALNGTALNALAGPPAFGAGADGRVGVEATT